MLAESAERKNQMSAGKLIAFVAIMVMMLAGCCSGKVERALAIDKRIYDLEQKIKPLEKHLANMREWAEESEARRKKREADED